MPCPNHPISHSHPEYDLAILNLIILHKYFNVSIFLIWFFKDPDWRLWQVRLLPWLAAGLAGQRQLQQEERWPLLLHDPGAAKKNSEVIKVQRQNFSHTTSFKAASSHVKRLVGERGEWEVEVERLRFFFWIFFNFSFFWIKTEVFLSPLGNSTRPGAGNCAINVSHYAQCDW